MVFAAESVRAPMHVCAWAFYRALTDIHAFTRLSEIIAHTHWVSHWFSHAVLKQPHVIHDYYPY